MKLVTASRTIAVLLTVAAFYFASNVLIPVAVALICTLLLDPLVVRMERRGIARFWGAAISLVLFLLGLLITGAAVSTSFSRAMEQSPQYFAKAKSLRDSLSRKTVDIQSETTVLPKQAPVRESIQKVEVVEEFSSWQGFLLKLLGSAFEVFTLALFVPLLIFYLLIDKSNLLESFNALVGRRCYLPKLNSELPRMIQAFFKGNLLGGVLLIALHAVAFYAIGLKNSMGLALISGLVSLIPILGAPLAMILPIAQGLMQWTAPFPFVVICVSALLFHFVVGNVVLPQVIGSRANVNSATLIVGLLFWGWIWGAMGILLAIPLTAALKIVLESNAETSPLSNLMAARPRYILDYSRISRARIEKSDVLASSQASSLDQ